MGVGERGGRDESLGGMKMRICIGGMLHLLFVKLRIGLVYNGNY